MSKPPAPPIAEITTHNPGGTSPTTTGTIPTKPRRHHSGGAFHRPHIGTANAAYIGILSAGQQLVGSGVVAWLVGPGRLVRFRLGRPLLSGGGTGGGCRGAIR